MKLAEDFRAIARDALRGRWGSAALVCLLAGLLGAEIFGAPSMRIDLDSSEIAHLRDFFSTGVFLRYSAFLLLGGSIGGLYALLRLVVGGAATLGYAKYNLDLVDGLEPDVSTLFSQFHRLWDGFCLHFLRGLFTLLWYLLLIIPGVIAEYRYAMAAYILAENPDMTVREALRRSSELMQGNKFRLFCLSFSFIGWNILCSLPGLLLGGVMIGVFSRILFLPLASVAASILLGALTSFLCSLFLQPYVQASYAAFYRDISTPAAPSFDPEYDAYSYKMV